jgi:hypothetical protein
LSTKCLVTYAWAVAVVLCPLGINAQGNQLVIQKHIRTNRLAAVVVDSTGVAIPEVRISLFRCPAGEFKGSLHFVSIAETLSDQQGRFSFPWPSKRVCLQVKSPGMDLLQIEVLRDATASELEVKLVPGT